ARKCKTTAGGVRRFQDSKDKASTANLRHHALRCFGEEAVRNGTKGKDVDGTSGSIFSLFARQGRKPVNPSHRSHTNAELLTAGRPLVGLPGHLTISRDIKACFYKCRDRVTTLLREHPGRLHFATDAWTSPNHRAFVAWTVHLEYEGHMLAFLLDIVEVAEVNFSRSLFVNDVNICLSLTPVSQWPKHSSICSYSLGSKIRFVFVVSYLRCTEGHSDSRT
ncbi:hypothetical protein BC826DRAFT_915559, partial [Russula brevipes]